MQNSIKVFAVSGLVFLAVTIAQAGNKSLQTIQKRDLSPMSIVESNNQVIQIRDQIIQIAKQNTTNESQFTETRQELEGLIAELTKRSQPVDEAVLGQFSPGSWKQVWSDEANNDQPGGPKRQLNQIYQFISNQGWGFNFGVRELPNGALATFALKVQASVNGNRQSTEITEAYLRMGGLNPDESLSFIAQRIHEFPELTGTNEFVKRNAGRFPNGPIGAQGTLEVLFLDDTVKIGRAPNVYSGLSELYILVRQDLID